MIKNGKEYLDTKRKTIVPGLKRLTGKPYEVPKGTMKTAKAERGKTAARVTNVAKRAEVTAARKVATKKLAKSTAQAERGKTLGRAKKVETSIKRAASVKKLVTKTSKAERSRTESRKSTPRKPKKLY
jgi:hypothetical protein